MSKLGGAWKTVRRWPWYTQGVIALVALTIIVAPFQDDEPKKVETAAVIEDDPADDLPIDPGAQAAAPTEVQRQVATIVAPMTTPPTLPTSAPAPPPTSPPATVASPPAAPAPAPVAPRPAAAPASGCHPEYSGACLPPNSSDVDCASGSGNGPDYAEGPFQITGSDPYDLDRDGNGIACENG